METIEIKHDRTMISFVMLFILSLSAWLIGEGLFYYFLALFCATAYPLSRVIDDLINKIRR